MTATKRTIKAATIAAAFAFTATLALPAMAQSVDTSALSKSTNKKQPVDIESNAMEIFSEKNQAVFTGKVVATRGKVTLRAEKLVVDFIKEKEADGSDKTTVTFLNATGGVVIITRTQRITGRWARMDVKADKAVVGGNVVVKQGSSIIKGKKLKVNLKTDASEMTGGRVRGSFTPN